MYWWRLFTLNFFFSQKIWLKICTYKERRTFLVIVPEEKTTDSGWFFTVEKTWINSPSLKECKFPPCVSKNWFLFLNCNKGALDFLRCWSVTERLHTPNNQAVQTWIWRVVLGIWTPVCIMLEHGGACHRDPDSLLK